MSTSTDLLVAAADAEVPCYEVEIAVRHRRGSQFDVYLTIDEAEFALGTVEREGRRYFVAKGTDLRVKASGQFCAAHGVISLVSHFALEHPEYPNASLLLALAGQFRSVPNEHGLLFSNELGFVSIPGRD